jgi:hypothetical protein
MTRHFICNNALHNNSSAQPFISIRQHHFHTAATSRAGKCNLSHRQAICILAKAKADPNAHTLIITSSHTVITQTMRALPKNGTNLVLYRTAFLCDP